MPQRAATIESLPMAFEIVKAMQADDLEWGEGEETFTLTLSNPTGPQVSPSPKDQCRVGAQARGARHRAHQGGR